MPSHSREDKTQSIEQQKQPKSSKSEKKEKNVKMSDLQCVENSQGKLRGAQTNPPTSPYCRETDDLLNFDLDTADYDDDALNEDELLLSDEGESMREIFAHFDPRLGLLNSFFS